MKAPMNDLLLLVSFAVTRNFSSLYRYVQGINFSSTVGLLGLFTTAVGYLYRTRSIRNISTQREVSDSEGLRPLFFPSKTAHVRFFPKRHAFSYSYLLVGVPVGWQGSVGLLSVDDPQAKTWFRVDAENYLDRGKGHLGLEGKLKIYLKDQGFRPEDFPYAYLFTQPQFLGYFNNPVSFWYLYDSDRKLKAMILEVNNTFEERRAYLLTPDVSKSDTLDDVSETEPTSSLQKPVTFSETWAKDFHVSPFNSRKGFYNLKTSDPLHPSMSCVGALSGTITLLSSKSHPKLVARIFSEGQPIDPATMATPEKVKFLIKWWWIVYMTFPRVAYEAAKLWFKGLYVWSRPEPRKTTMSRSATASEAVLETHFRHYLQYLVNNCQKPLAVTYIPCGVKAATPIAAFKSPSALAIGDDEPVATMTLKVLTPSFYTRFVHYKNDLDALSCEFAESKTIEVDSADLLTSLIPKKAVEQLEFKSWSDAFIFETVRKLRSKPERIEEVSFIGKKDHNGEAATGKDKVKLAEKEDSGNSSMDAWIWEKCMEEEKGSYRWEVLKSFIADKFAMGDVGLLGMEWWTLKAGVLWWVAGWLRI